MISSIPIALLAVPLCCCGCRLPYLIRQAAGQVEILARTIPIEQAQRDASTEDGARRGLTEILEIREFARAHGLDVGDAYASYVDLGGQPPVYVVSACLPDSLELLRWRFPIVGEFPYRGFFDLDAARRIARRLRGKGYETRIRTADAYSTLGWFDDPLFSTFLEDSLGARADLLFHELTHRTVFIDGDVAFNESLATFVARVLTRQYLESKFGPDSTEWHKHEARQHDYAWLVARIERTIGALGIEFRARDRETRLAGRARVIARLAADVEAHEFRSSTFAGWHGIEWTMPLLLSFSLYSGDVALFDRAWKSSEHDLERFLQLMASVGDGPDATGRLRRLLDTASIGSVPLDEPPQESSESLGTGRAEAPFEAPFGWSRRERLEGVASWPHSGQDLWGQAATGSR